MRRSAAGLSTLRFVLCALDLFVVELINSNDPGSLGL
jgi:hypothetical protein